MNDIPMKQDHAASPSPPVELSPPNFDDLAVLTAQPVEPLAHHPRDWFAVLEKPRMIIAMLIVGALLATTAVALILQLRRPHVDTAATEIQPEKSASEPSGQTEPSLEEEAEQPKLISPRTRAPKSRLRLRTITVETKPPVARRVGVIFYGNDSDRP